MAQAASLPRTRGQIPRRNPCRKGFTLLEIILTVILLTGGIFALSQAMSRGMLASTDVENTALALNIAQAKMEEIKGTVFANITGSGPLPDPSLPNFNVTVTVTGTDPKQVGVTVAWNAPGGSTNVALTTLIANY